MKSILFSIAAVMTLAACTNNNQENNTKAGDSSANTTSTKQNTANVETLLSQYLDIKNALAKDDGSGAARAGKKLSETVQEIDTASLSAEQKKVFNDVREEVAEHGEHIGKNADKIDHQREHFSMLSDVMYALLKVVKPTQTVYVDHCPMYKKGKGADWLSETKDIKNPYLGKEMPDCGSVTEEIKR